MNTNVISAIFRRNFNSYFNSPTGYVFICLFVVLCALAAFCDNAFFNSNLANLDALTKWMPGILLVFIPAVTMSIWADERRQGTDELLLTIPAADFDVVLGKYLAAVAIYTVALLFSMICNWAMLALLGQPDAGLLLGTYVGYWLAGLAMLGIGMVASFLTSNLTVAFVLGALFIAPLVLLQFVDRSAGLLPEHITRSVSALSVARQFKDFGRGVISLSGVVYFVALVAVSIYLCMVLIGRRHWLGKKDGAGLGLHYAARALCLLTVATCAVVVFRNLHSANTRLDVTAERLSSLSPKTLALLAEIKPERPVRIDAYISPEVPEQYVPTRLNLLSMLDEFEARGRGNVEVHIHNTEPLTKEADLADDQFGITAQDIQSLTRGTFKHDRIFLGVAFTSGLNKVVVPFFDRGVPVEYELVRSICTVSQQSRKKIGILSTEARLMGGFDQATFQATGNQAIVDELKKQYEIVTVSPDAPITGDFDVLLAVQPSSLSPEQLNNFITLLKTGKPVAIFEDPFPYFYPNVTATSAPRRGQQNMMFGGGPPEMPKGNIFDLWTLLGIDFGGNDVIWQDYNPYPEWSDFPKEFVFVDSGSSDSEVFNEQNSTSSRLQQLMFLFPGSMTHRSSSDLKFDWLV